MLSRAVFEQDLIDLKEKFEAIATNAPQWRLIKHLNDLYCTTESAILWKGETIVRKIHITYSITYSVPILWFNYYRRDGSLLHLDEIINLISPEHRNAVVDGLLTSISQNEHPYLGVAFYHIHPCKTQDVMRDVHSKNFVLR